MTFFIPLWLSLVAFMGLYSPLEVYESLDCPAYTQGYVKDGEVYICPNNLTMPRQEVINHEVVHLIQSNLGVDTLLPHEALNYLINNNMSEMEKLNVILVYYDSGYMMQEFEARLLQTLPDDVIMNMYRLSQGYASTNLSD